MSNAKQDTSPFGGGLVTRGEQALQLASVKIPANASIPQYIDNRPYCLTASDQGENPHCAGYTMAGYLEVVNWMQTHVAEQVDGDALYYEAKKVDGSPNTDGTTLTAVVQAAKNLEMINSQAKPRVITTLDELCFALHKHGVVLGGFNINSNWGKVSADGWLGKAKNPTAWGGHAVLINGYQLIGGKSKDYVSIQNSWKPKWGYRGFARLTIPQFKDEFMYGVVIDR